MNDPYTEGYIAGLEAARPLIEQLRQQLADEERLSDGYVATILRITALHDAVTEQST